MDGFAGAALAVAVILSAVVRMIRTDASFKAIDEGYASAVHLFELTGIQKKDLQDVFGPPTLEGIYRATRSDIENSRKLLGWVMGDMRSDMISIMVAALVLAWHPFGWLGDILELVFLSVVIYQCVGWFMVARTGQSR